MIPIISQRTCYILKRFAGIEVGISSECCHKGYAWIKDLPITGGKGIAMKKGGVRGFWQ
ncbi:unnamed protein product [Protopolystoma xenopodis]|uniref:Uncharacterized protein n=1 Tax=Protopolystoma xenopodis TaxID=117903 RepID=A0A448WUJ4_9PLAT|nr:unnamed protein product [Protopolystoma xenopodis]